MIINENKFIYEGERKMARKTDMNKIENIKKAAIEMMTEYGFKGTTIADIAKKAGVSTGYLYRHYDSKEALVDDIIDTYMKQMMDTFIELFNSANNFQECIREFVTTLFQWAKQEDVFAVRFITTLALDKKMIQSFLEVERDACVSVHNFLEICLKQNQINLTTTMEDFIIIVITTPFKYLETRMSEENYKELLNLDLEKRIAEICINALR